MFFPFNLNRTQFADSSITLQNCKVYYESVIDEGATINVPQSSCEALLPVRSGDTFDPPVLAAPCGVCSASAPAMILILLGLTAMRVLCLHKRLRR